MDITQIYPYPVTVMTAHATVLASVWEHVSRQPRLSESIREIRAALRGVFETRSLEVGSLDVAAARIDMVAAAADEPVLAAHLGVATDEVRHLLSWSANPEVRSARSIRTDLPSFGRSPDSTLIVPLGAAPTVGLLLATPLRARDADANAARFLFRLRDPFTVALHNDQEFRTFEVARESIEAENRALLHRLGRRDLGETIVGSQSGLRGVMERVSQVASSDLPVLILGETGSGKELVARAIHNRSSRAGKAFIRVNCGAIPPDLIDSELFGHERGSFTGATSSRKGWFERADGGTLLLDEIGELPLAAQVRLLRILQDGTYYRVGAQTQTTANVRIVAATHRDLREMVRERTFREDLWYRVAVFPIALPPLRERTDDIPELASHFAQRACLRFGLAPLSLSRDDIHLLLSYSWPGNIRELAAVIDRAAILGNGKFLDVRDALGSPEVPGAGRAVTVAPARADADRSFPTLDNAMRVHIEEALRRTGGRIEGSRGAAALLAINPYTLRARMRKLRIEWNRFRVAKA